MANEITTLRRQLRKEGYAVVWSHGNGHWKIYDSAGEHLLASIPASSGSGRTACNTRRDIRKAERLLAGGEA